MAAERPDDVPRATLEWLLEEENPAVAVLTRRWLLGQADTAETSALWARRNEYAPVVAILDAQLEDGSWAPPAKDYQKYGGNLWQIHFLGELWADGTDERVRRGADYAFSRQLDDGSWSASNMRPGMSIPCLTANVGRALARLGHATDERVLAALEWSVRLYERLGTIDCSPQMADYQLNGYCHMVTPKLLLFLGQVPREVWPEGTENLKEACVSALRDKEIFRCLPAESRVFQQMAADVSTAERHEFRARFLAEHEPLRFEAKPGWLKFGFPLSYNSDTLEALRSLAEVGERRRAEYEPALELLETSADSQMRWQLKNSFNGKMIGDVEAKGRPSKWLTLHALRVLGHFADKPS